MLLCQLMNGSQERGTGLSGGAVGAECEVSRNDTDAGQNSQCWDMHWELIMGELIQVALAARKSTAPPRTPPVYILGHSRTPITLGARRTHMLCPMSHTGRP